MRNILSVLIGIILLAQPCFAQENAPDSVKIGSITVLGNEKTKDYIITRELEFTSGDVISIEELNQARFRIFNLNLFNNVEFYFDEKEDSYDLNIFVYERWYIFPIPIFFINERDWDKLSYGLGVSHSNFRGRAEQVWASGWLGYNPGFSVNYYNRWFAGEKRLYTQFSMFSQRINTKSFQFLGEDEKHSWTSLLLGRRFGLHWYVNTTVGVNFIGATDRDMLWQSSSPTDKIATWQFLIRHDTRDLWEYPKNGAHRRISFIHNRLLNGGSNYNLWSADFREYRSFKGITFAGRVAASLTQNQLPVYRRLYFGYRERIRGYFDGVAEGDNRFIASAEVRVPVIREKLIPLSSDSWYYSFIQFIKFGLYVTAFYDTGTIWDQDENFSDANFLKGKGIGLNVILPYSVVLRFERAYNEEGIGENIFDFQIAF